MIDIYLPTYKIVWAKWSMLALPVSQPLVFLSPRPGACPSVHAYEPAG